MSANRLGLNLLRRPFVLPTVSCPSSAGCCIPLDYLQCDDFLGLDPRHGYTLSISCSNLINLSLLPTNLLLIRAAQKGLVAESSCDAKLAEVKSLPPHLEVCHFFWQRDKYPLCSQLFNTYYLHLENPQRSSLGAVPPSKRQLFIRERFPQLSTSLAAVSSTFFAFCHFAVVKSTWKAETLGDLAPWQYWHAETGQTSFLYPSQYGTPPAGKADTYNAR